MDTEKIDTSKFSTIKDPIEQAIFRAGYEKYIKGETGNAELIVYSTGISLIVFPILIVFLAVRTYRKNNPRVKIRRAT